MKKKLFVIICSLLSALICLEIAQSFDAIITTASADENKIIVIDPGHGGEDGGAIGQNGINEKDINLSISLILKALFEDSGYTVVMTREGDYSIGDDSLGTIAARKASDIKDRVNICNSSNAKMVLSIHQNYFSEAKYSGAQMFYGTVDGSEALAESIQTEIRENTQPENNRKIKATTDKIYLLNNSTIPSVIVECGFISNYDESLRLINKDYQRQIAYSIYLGALDYINL